jgi:putative acetyltransferase
VGEIKRMFVRPAARGRGIARLLLARLEVEARARGFRLLRLETGSLQPDARGLYERAGYRPIPCFGPYAGAPHSRCYERRIEA